MIVVQLLGGLGNQMFQYAAGRRLALEKSVPLKLDIQSFETYTLRSYRLFHFATQAEIATPAELRQFVAPGIGGKARRLAERRLLPRERRHIYYERTPYQFEVDILNTPDDVYLQGFFQTEAYFKPVEAIIHQDFTIKTPPDVRNREMAARIGSVHAVSLHIRRGDYASNAETRAFHGLLPLDYYQTAMRRIAETIAQPHFFVFSDDPAWAREYLQLDYPLTLVDHNDAEHDIDDLRLMSLCRHHVIANSSFSWWGAWLCTYPEKIVYAPERWILDRSINSRGAVPPNWQRVPIQEH
jgi:hypothetical protein